MAARILSPPVRVLRCPHPRLPPQAGEGVLTKIPSSASSNIHLAQAGCLKFPSLASRGKDYGWGQRGGPGRGCLYALFACFPLTPTGRSSPPPATSIAALIQNSGATPIALAIAPKITGPMSLVRLSAA